MKMMAESVDDAIRHLTSVKQELGRRGDPLSAEVGAALEILEAAERRSEPDLMTTGEASEALGVRSRNTIKRWARQGLLEGFQRGGRILVSRRSVEDMRRNSALSKQHEREQAADAAWEPFSATDDEVAVELEELRSSRIGRVPWERRGDLGG
jgi:excisionase family DNA binding protein